MLSNLASYIFGNNETEQQNEEPIATQPTLSDEEEEWVVVGGNAQPSLTLGSLNEAAPRPSTGSTGSSSTPSEAPESSSTQLSRTERRLATPFGSCAETSLAHVKAVRSSQKSKQKEKSKSLSSKALERRNKAVKATQSKKKFQMASANFKASGLNKQLKQC